MTMYAGRCPNDHVTYPTHHLCPECGRRQDDRVELQDRTATVVTWTTATATPPGVRTPNPIAIVEFEVDGDPVRAIGGLVDGAEVDIGDEVQPVHVDELRDPEAGIREPDSHRWDGYRFEPV